MNTNLVKSLRLLSAESGGGEVSEEVAQEAEDMANHIWSSIGQLVFKKLYDTGNVTPVTMFVAKLEQRQF